MAKDSKDTQTLDAFSEKRGRGRPKKPDALTNAERQARFKEKKRSLLKSQDASFDLGLDDAFSRPGYQGRKNESLRNLVLVCALRRRNSQHAELCRAVQVLQARLRDAGLNDNPQQGYFEDPYYWNENPPVDYRPTGPSGDNTPHQSQEEEDKWPPGYLCVD